MFSVYDILYLRGVTDRIYGILKLNIQYLKHEYSVFLKDELCSLLFLCLQ